MNKRHTKVNDEDEDFVFPVGKQPLGYSVRTQQLCNFTVHFCEEIKDASYYTRVFDMLLQAGENDIVNMMLASPGGDLDGLNMVLEGIRLTDAHVCAVIVGACHSAASILALNCHDVVVTDSASMLVHNIRTGFSGKMADLDAYTKFSKQMADKLIVDTYSGFLNESEIREVIHGKELWFTADEIRERLENRQAYLEEKYEAEQVALKEAATPAKPSRKRKGPVQA